MSPQAILTLTMNHRVAGWWNAARPPSLVVVLLVGLALGGAWGCGAGGETVEEPRGSAPEAELPSEPAAAAEAERAPESSAPGEAAERPERDGEHAGEREAAGEHDSGSEHGEEAGESGTRYGVSETARETRSGVDLVLRFEPAAGAFVGTVANTGAEPVSRVRVEVHLVGAVELGPTPTITLAPGETRPVRLEAGGHAFEAWMAHVEIGEGEHGGERHRGS